MAKTRDQKKKLLYVYKILTELTDEEHPMSAADIILELEKYDIYTERKSIYTDIQALLDYGCDILNKRGKERGYYVANREFELVELKLLIDAVQSSKFITSKDSKKVIGKLKSLTNVYDAKKLQQRNVNISEPIKNKNKQTYIIVDHIHTAINENSSIEFQYYDWNMNKEFVARSEGDNYKVSPWALTWHNDNYYMIGYNHTYEEIRHYRVDKMKKIKITHKSRLGKDDFDGFDLNKYTTETFAMFKGKSVDVTLECKQSMAGVIVDRFGADVTMRGLGTKDENYGTMDFNVRIRVAVSPQFYGWVAGLGENVKIVNPPSVKESYRNHIIGIYNQYQ